MSAITLPSLLHGQIFDLTESQMDALQLNPFYSTKAGRGTSSLPEYKDYIFAWFTSADLLLTPVSFDMNTSTRVKASLIYYLVVVEKSFLPPIGQPMLMSGTEFYGLGIRLDGRSDRPDLQNYRFRFSCIGAETDQLIQLFYVIVTKNDI